MKQEKKISEIKEALKYSKENLAMLVVYQGKLINQYIRRTTSNHE